MATTKTREMNETEAVYETLEYICDFCDSETVLRELFDNLSIDRQIRFLHDFIQDYDVDTSELNDDTINVITAHYKLHC